MSKPFLPYGRQTIEDDDVEAVARALRADFLTTGPLVAEFEAAFAGSERLENLDAGGNDLLADTVAGNDRDPVWLFILAHREVPLILRRRQRP